MVDGAELELLDPLEWELQPWSDACPVGVGTPVLDEVADVVHIGVKESVLTGVNEAELVVLLSKLGRLAPCACAFRNKNSRPSRHCRSVSWSKGVGARG